LLAGAVGFHHRSKYATIPLVNDLMDRSHRIPASSSISFDDPDRYHAAIRGGDHVLSFLSRGTFRADVTTIEVGQVMLQRGHENLPRLSSSGIPPNKVGILGWFGDSDLPLVRGVQIRRGDWMVLGPGMQSHHRSHGAIDFVTLTLDVSDLARVAVDLLGYELTVTAGQVLRPPEHLGAWLLSVIEAAISATGTTPGIFTSPLAAAALEHALLRPMIMSLQSEVRKENVPHGRRPIIVKRFEEAVEANFDHPLLMPDLCRIIGVSGRTLRTLCQEQLGVSPQRFLALRRLHLARRALLHADHHCATVTQIATAHGVWELGRFATAYKSLFGESPSATLHRPSDILTPAVPDPRQILARSA
jgi:AraC-like DNA-binding protein